MHNSKPIKYTSDAEIAFADGPAAAIFRTKDPRTLGKIVFLHLTLSQPRVVKGPTRKNIESVSLALG